jgi:poly(3-hydroxybutyrate) depolymerase
MEGWSERLHCAGSGAEEPLAVRVPDDPTRVFRRAWQGCDAPLTLVRIRGGGHAWPDGHAYFRERRIGPVSRQVSGSELVGAWVVDTDTRVRARRPGPDAP